MRDVLTILGVGLLVLAAASPASSQVESPALPCEAITVEPVNYFTQDSPGLLNGRAYDRASIELRGATLVELPAGAQVAWHEGRDILLYLEKELSFDGDAGTVMNPCSARRFMGCAYKLRGNRLRIGTYGEWRNPHGSADIRMIVALPLTIRSVGVASLAGERSEAANLEPYALLRALDEDPEQWFALKRPAQGWTVISSVPDEAMVARQRIALPETDR